MSITKREADKALREVVGITGFNVTEKARGYTFVRQALDALPAEIKDAADEFISRPMVSIHDDELHMRKMVWPIVDKILNDISITAQDWEMSHKNDKYIHAYSMGKKVESWQKKLGISSDHLPTEDVAKDRDLDVEQYYIPAAALRRNKPLYEAVRREVMGEQLEPAQTALLKEHADNVQQFHHLLFSLAYETLTHPVAQLDGSLNAGAMVLGQALGEPIGPERTEMTRQAGHAFKQAKLSQDFIRHDLDVALEDANPLTIPPEFIKQANAFVTALEQAQTKWKSHYEINQEDQIRGIANRVRKFESTESSYAQEQVWGKIPLPLGDDPLLTDHIGQIKASVESLGKKLEGNAQIALVDPDFVDMYSSLMSLRERLQMPVHRAGLLAETQKRAEAGDLSIGVPSKELKRLIADVAKFSDLAANGYPADKLSPQNIRNQLDTLQEPIAQQMGMLEKTAFMFLRLAPHLDKLIAYCDQEQTVNPATSAATTADSKGDLQKQQSASAPTAARKP